MGPSQDPAIHRFALSALSPLAYIPENGAQIIDAGGVSAVKNTLQYHSGDPQVAISALSMINELAKHDGCKDSLVNAGIIPILLNVMQGHAANPHVQAQGLKCLATLCANNTSIQSGLHQGDRVWGTMGHHAVSFFVNMFQDVPTILAKAPRLGLASYPSRVESSDWNTMVQ